MSKRAAIYTRISRDLADEEHEEARKEADDDLTSRLKSRKGVQRQAEDCHALAKKRGYTVVAEFEDNDISASTQSRKVRPRYAAMLEAVRAGQVDVIVAYSNSRLTRRLRELLDLIDLHGETGVKIETVVSGSDDLSTADGIMVAQIKASVDEAEARRTAERLRRKFLEKAQAGKENQGGRPFGWADDKIALHPKESRLLKRAVQDVIDGVPTREVARRWNDAGVTTTRGSAWTHTAVRALLRSPRLAGWRVHGFQCAACAFRGDGGALSKHQKTSGHVGRDKAIARDADGQPVRGVWKPLLDQETSDALQAALDGRRPRTRRGAQRYLLSTILRCGECGSKMHGFRTREGSHAYACSSDMKGHSVTVAGRQTDDLVVALVTQRLASVDLSGETPAAPAWPGEARLAAIPGQIKELMAAYKAGTVSGAVTFPAVADLETEQARLEAERPTAPPRPVTVSADALPDLDLDRRRAVVEALIDAVVVAKAAHRGARWTPDRLEVVWR